MNPKERDKPKRRLESPASKALGAVIKKARHDVHMSLRDVEHATDRNVSNAYLSQLESGKIVQPSPHVLFALARALSVDYEILMERAGYVLPDAEREGRNKLNPPSFSIDNLTPEEETQLLDYLAFLRAKKK